MGVTHLSSSLSQIIMDLHLIFTSANPTSRASPYTDLRSPLAMLARTG